MRRYELLRHLHQRGVNDFDAYRLTEARKPKRFPVFIRGENDHNGPESRLIGSQTELDDSVDALRRLGRCLDNRLVI